MTEIDVPDWVVEVAAEAISKRHLSNTGVPFPIAACRDDARAALTAALGAWVVPAHFATDGAGDVPVFEEFTELDQAYAHAGDDGWVVEAYALRQEKPE